MKFKKDNNLQNNEQTSNKKIADMLLSNLLKGKAIQESEDVPETDPSDVINNNDPSSTIQVSQKKYSVDKTSMSSSVLLYRHLTGLKNLLKIPMY